MEDVSINENEINTAPINSLVESNEAVSINPTLHEIESETKKVEALLIPVTVVDEKDEMNRLHRGIVGNGRITLIDGIRLGELATNRKASLKRTWGSWVATNLDFDIRTAQNYMRLHKNRVLLLEKYETDSYFGLRDAYRLLAKEAKKRTTPTISEELQDGGALDGGIEIVEAEETGVTLEPENGFEADTVSPTPRVPVLVVDRLTPEQLTQVVELLRELGVDGNSYRVQGEQGEGLRQPFQEELTPDSEGAVEAEDATEVPNE